MVKARPHRNVYALAVGHKLLKQDTDTATHASPSNAQKYRPMSSAPTCSAVRLTRPIAVAIAVHPATCFRSLLCLLHGFHQPVRTAPACMRQRTWRGGGCPARVGADRNAQRRWESTHVY